MIFSNVHELAVSLFTFLILVTVLHDSGHLCSLLLSWVQIMFLLKEKKCATNQYIC